MAARILFSLAAIVLGLAVALVDSARAQAEDDHSVLILSSTVSGGATSVEASAAADLGYTVDIVTPTEWAAMDADDFASYRAIILGDPTCVYSTSPVSAAIANRDVWGPVIDGNVVLMASDPVYHVRWGPSAGARALIEKTLAFVLSVPDEAGRTGAYICLSCYYEYHTGSVPLLEYIYDGGFSTAPAECHNDVHITAMHPALEDLTDADLSNWYCSIHAVFTAWDTENFEVLAIGEGLGTSYTDDDGTVGSPYILAKGVCDHLPTIEVSLDPSYIWPPNNRMINVAATITTTGNGVEVELVSITSDESGGDEDVAEATFNTDDRAFQVRAERDGSGDGRVYTVTYRVTDECGYTAEASAIISVPHDQR